MAKKLLYLVRHGEHDDPGTEIDDGLLTETGKEQARLLGARLRAVPFSTIAHSPLRRATQTAAILSASLPGVPLHPSDLLRDCIPSVPDREGLSLTLAAFFDQLSPVARTAGPEQAAAALLHYAVPPAATVEEDVYELLITHNFVIGWFVAHALSAPSWRWIGLNQFNCGLTIICYRPDRPAALVSYNDIGHLPPALRGANPPLLLPS